MYQNTQALNKTQSIKYSQLNSYTFASDQNFCPVFLQELPQLVREYFIIFPNNNTDLPHVLLGFEEGKNKYVAANGDWQADYIPAYIRRYPFTLAKVEGKDDFTLAADMDAPHFKRGTENLFDSAGKPTQLLQVKINLLKALENQRMATQKAVQEIDQAGLFKMEKLTVKSGDQAVSSIGGLRMIDEEKLADCGLAPGPALELVYAHMFSKANLKYGVLAGRDDMGVRLKDDGELDIDWDKIKI